MTLWNVKALAAAAICLLGIFVSPSVGAAVYTDSFNVDPTTFKCGYFVTSEICGWGTGFGGGRVLNAGDQLTENITYTSPVTVPGSDTVNLLYVGLPDAISAGGPPPPGPDSATYSSTLQGYSGPSAPLVGPYTLGYLHTYLALAGFCCGYGVPNTGFTVTGISSTFTINASDPNPIYYVSYGYSVDLPATPQLLSDIAGGTVDHPAILPPGEIGAISSNISGGVSDSQFYNFTWQGGVFQAQGSIANANPLADFQFELLDPYNTSNVFADIVLNSADNFTGLINLDLAAGDYEVGMYTDSPFDPTFTINFDTPVKTSPNPSPSPSSALV